MGSKHDRAECMAFLNRAHKKYPIDIHRKSPVKYFVAVNPNQTAGEISNGIGDGTDN
jgi:hypothetical protein